MTVKELRVSNKLSHQGIVREIFSIDKRGFVTFDVEPVVQGKFKIEQSASIHIKECSGIPLSEKVLEDYNFKRVKNGIGWDTFKNGVLELVEVPTNKGKLIAFDRGSGKYTYVRFEHQLQNLYFELANKEL